jgi:acetylglutamate kinase
MLDVAVMIYAGQINKNIVAQLQAHNLMPWDFGADGNLIQSEKETIPPSITDFVGDVKYVNAARNLAL